MHLVESLTPILVLTVFIAIFGIGIVVLSYFLGPKRDWTKAKLMSYESGLPGKELKKTQIPVKFYLTAILFIIFDIEIVFMYPWAVSYLDFLEAGHGLFIFFSMLFFIGLFILGLIWEIKSKALEWE